jgi:hypothetical protein
MARRVNEVYLLKSSGPSNTRLLVKNTLHVTIHIYEIVISTEAAHGLIVSSAVEKSASQPMQCVQLILLRYFLSL